MNTEQPGAGGVLGGGAQGGVILSEQDAPLHDDLAVISAGVQEAAAAVVPKQAPAEGEAADPLRDVAATAVQEAKSNAVYGLTVLNFEIVSGQSLQQSLRGCPHAPQCWLSVSVPAWAPQAC